MAVLKRHMEKDTGNQVRWYPNERWMRAVTARGLLWGTCDFYHSHKFHCKARTLGKSAKEKVEVVK